MNLFRSHLFELATIFLLKYVFSTCPPGWDQIIDLCYAPSKIMTTWAYAQILCNKLDVRSHLPIFKDVGELRLFTMEVKQTSYQNLRGITDKAKQPPCEPEACERWTLQFWSLFDSIPLGAYKNNDSWVWQDGRKIEDKIVHPEINGKQNKDEDPYPSAPRYLSYDPIETSCHQYNFTQQIYFICQFDPQQPQTKCEERNEKSISFKKNKECPAEWDNVEGLCYKLPQNEKQFTNNADGTKACQYEHPSANLPQFYNQNEFYELAKYIGSISTAANQNINLGLFGYSKNYITKERQGSFYYWMKDEPQNNDCVIMNDIYGYRWKTVNCTSIGFNICQLDLRTSKNENETIEEIDPRQSILYKTKSGMISLLSEDNGCAIKLEVIKNGCVGIWIDGLLVAAVTVIGMIIIIHLYIW